MTTHGDRHGTHLASLTITRSIVPNPSTPEAGLNKERTPGSEIMFRLFKRSSDAVHPLVLLDPHTTSPGHDEPTIIRNDTADGKEKFDIYGHAQQIYSRAKYSGQQRSAGII